GRPHIASLASVSRVDFRVLDFESGGFHALFDKTLSLSPASAGALDGHEIAVNMAASGHAIFSRRLASSIGGDLIDIRPRPARYTKGHISDQGLADLAATGFAATAGPPRMQISREKIDAELERHSLVGKHPLVIVHPGSGGRAKCWPLDNYVAVTRRLQT